MFGENPDEQDVPEADRNVSYAHKSALRRFFIVFAGPLFNIIFPVLVFWVLFSCVGVPQPVDNTTVGAVTEDSPAATAGVQQGDVIVAIQGQETTQWVDVLNGIKKSGGNEVKLTVRRGDKRIDLLVQPALSDAKDMFGEVVEKRYMVGIVKDNSVAYSSVGFGSAFVEACKQTWYFIYLTVLGFVKIVERVVPVSEIGGPILIAKIAGEQMREGWINLTYFIGLLSINLGILNLLPIPVLDGGHLLFYGIEAVRRRPLSQRMQEIGFQIGIALVLMLMVYVNLNDLLRVWRRLTGDG